MNVYRAVGDVHVLASSQAAPGHGVLPVNAYLVADQDPVLVDTGLPADRDGFLEALWSLVDPDDLRLVFLTHEDRDHAGNLLAVLEAAPATRLVTNYVTLGKLLEAWPVPLDRVVVANPGERVPTATGRLTVVRPPVYDAPGTVGLYDAATGAAFTVDAFGTYLPEAVEDLADVPDDQVEAGLVDFNRVNHPWTALVDPARFARVLDELRRRDPALLLSSHGAVPRGRTDLLFRSLSRLPDLEPFHPPDQSAFESLKDEMGGS